MSPATSRSRSSLTTRATRGRGVDSAAGRTGSAAPRGLGSRSRPGGRSASGSSGAGSGPGERLALRRPGAEGGVPEHSPCIGAEARPALRTQPADY